MSDLIRLENLLSEFGVEHDRIDAGGQLPGCDQDIGIMCCQGGEKVSGYTRFYTLFKFTPCGDFIEMGAWK